MSRRALDELKQQIHLLDYLQAQDWRPARQLSRGRLMGLCPLHEDHQPSFLVDPHKNLFYCYGCDRGGDVIRFTNRAGSEDSVRKFDEMFRRRLEKGQFYMQPYLGCREFPAVVEPYTGTPPPIDSATRELGYMLHDLRYGSKGNEPVFFRAKLERGVIEVPQWEAAA